jgi:hypothetical protein
MKERLMDALVNMGHEIGDRFNSRFIKQDQWNRRRLINMLFIVFQG